MQLLDIRCEYDGAQVTCKIAAHESARRSGYVGGRNRRASVKVEGETAASVLAALIVALTDVSDHARLELIELLGYSANLVLFGSEDGEDLMDVYGEDGKPVPF